MESTPTNPYSAPVSNPYGSGTGSTDAVSPSTISALVGTKPWVRFLSIMLWIGIGLMLLGAAFIAIASATGLPGSSGRNPLGGPEMILITVIYAVLALIYIYPAIKLWAYGSRIGALSVTRSLADLDAALTEQRRFWKFAGIIMIILICTYIIMFIGIFAFAGATAFKAGGFPR